MRELYDMTVFAAEDTDYETEGLCGPLVPVGEPELAVEAGGELSLDFEHPYDPEGRWRSLVVGNTVRAWMQMRIPPEPDDLGEYAATVEVWRVSSLAGKTDRYLYSTRTDSSKTRKIKLLKGGLKVAIVKAYESGRWKVKTKYGTGWMNQEGLDSTQSETVVVDPDGAGLDDILGVDFRPQLFDITTIERNRESLAVHCTHISYRLMKNVTRYVATGNVKGVTAAKKLLENCLDDHTFSIYSDVADTRAGASWNYVNPIEAIMDPEAGLMARWGMELLRDNFDLYVLHNVGRDRGVTIEVGRNLAGITVTEDASGIATYVMPLGVKKDGTPLLLDEVWLVSPHANEYPQKHIYAFWAEDATVDDDANTATVKNRMRAQAQALLDAGCDLPALTVDVEVAQVDDPQAQSVVEMLEPVLEYDTVRVYDAERGMMFEDKCLRRVEDPIHGRLLSMELGNTTGRLGTTQIASWQVPSGISGGKILTGTMDSAPFKDGVILARLIAAQAITAEKMAAGSIDTLLLTAFNAVIQNLEAGHVEADTLDAAAAYIATLEAGFANFTRAQITNLVSNALTLDFGTLDEVFISNLSVLYAQVVNATIGNLCLKASDGVYYMIDVESDGTVTATAKSPQPTAAEIAAGVTTGGQHIVETSITAQEMSTGTLHATFELVNKIDAARIDVDTLVARQALIDQLAAREIIGENTIRMIAGQAQQAGAIQRGGRVFRDTPDPPYDVNDLWLQADENELYICVTAKGENETFDVDDWVISNAHDMTARTIRDEVNAMIEVDTDGLHVKGVKLEDGEIVDTENQVVVTPIGVDVKVGAETYSRFGARYAQFGAYQIRESHDGGLVFKLGDPLDDEDIDGPHPEED